MLKPRKKFSKKELRQDKFVTATFKTQAFVQENRNNVVMVVVGILGLFVAAIMYMGYVQDSKAEVGTLVTEGSLFLEQGNRDAGLSKLKKAAFEYSDESAAYAAFLLGKEYLTQDHADSAITYFQLAIDNSGSDDLLGPAYLNLASCQQITGDLEEAENNYHAAVGHSPFPDFKANALYNLGLVQETLNKNDKAISTFTQLVDEFPNSDMVNKAEIHLNKLK